MAGRIPEEIIDEIRHQADIVDVISEYVALSKTGQNYKGLCPFHNEKTPSFVVNPQKQLFRCYGCGVGGNVFTFLMQHEQYSFPEAVYVLAKRVGIQLPNNKAEKYTPQQLGQLETLYTLHTEVAGYFTSLLLNAEEGQSARDYLRRRGIQAEQIRQFSLGYALPGWESLRRKFLARYSKETLLESGLIIKRKGGGEYDRFRDRLMIPIRDDRGRIIAFGGRILGDGDPKYLNSPESPIFHKSQTLFGLSLAKKEARRRGHIIIAEGYFDMLIPYYHGVPNVVATMGTALTEDHLRLMQRYAKRATLMFDADAAGINAATRSLDLFLKFGFDVRAAVLPEEDDPDSFVRRAGAEQFQTFVEQAVPLLDFVRERIIERYDLSRIDQQIACANHLLPTLVKIQDLMERAAQINKTADLLNIEDRALLQELKKVAETGKPELKRLAPHASSTMPPLEKALIQALLKDKRLIPWVQEEVLPNEMSHPVTRKVLRELFKYGSKTDFEAHILDAFQGDEDQNMIVDLCMQTDAIVDPDATVEDCLNRLQQTHFNRETYAVTRNMRAAQEHHDDESLIKFLEQKNKHLQHKREKIA